MFGGVALGLVATPPTRPRLLPYCLLHSHCKTARLGILEAGGQPNSCRVGKAGPRGEASSMEKRRCPGVHNSHHWPINKSSLASHTLLTRQPMAQFPELSVLCDGPSPSPSNPTEGWPPPSPGSSPKIKLVLQSWLETSDIPCQAIFGLSEVS